jgi:Fe-S cluster assembly protein SufD
MSTAERTDDTGTDLAALVKQGQALMSVGAQGPGWLSDARRHGAQQVRRIGWPERKEEAWRYTPVGFLKEARYQPTLHGPFSALRLDDIETLLLAPHDGVRLVFVNGFFAPQLSALAGDHGGVVMTTLGGSLGDVPAAIRSHLDQVAEHRHVFAALNSALMSDGACVLVPSAVQASQPIELLHISVGLDDPGISHPRHLVVLEDGASARIVERYCSLGDAVYFNNAMVEVAVGAGSELVHERLQEESSSAQHLSDLHVRLDAGSRYRLVQAALGAAWSRSDIRVLFEGEGAEAQLDGLMLAHDRQLNDVHLDIQHKVPDCTSRESFKGILDGSGRVVFDGRILVERDAQRTDAMLSNHNLMLSRAAEVDTKPQLEIFADDVKCSHGTTVGELDHDMLFYLRSRGVPLVEARQMLCAGFAQEVLDRIENTALRARAGRQLTSRLKTAV